MLKMKLLLLLLFNPTKIFFALGLDMTIALDIAMAMAKAPSLYKLDNFCTLTRVGEYRKIPAFPSSHQGTDSVQ